MLEDTKLTLVLFRDAIEHMSRVARVLALERGHFMVKIHQILRK
jgi:dynein heavy chain